MSKTLFSLLLFVASTMAKGRGGSGSSGGSSIDDGWEAPGEVKATMAFAILWFIACLYQLYQIIKNLKVIPAPARSPYIFLMVVTSCLGLYYLLFAILIRMSYMSDVNELIIASTFFFNVDAAFRPSVVLYLIHQRGDVLRALKGGTTVPLSTQMWKRILDWCLAGFSFVMYTAALGITGARITGFASRTYRELEALYQAGLGVGRTALAFLILLCIDVVVSLTVQYVQGTWPKPRDLVTTRLLKVIVPLFVLYMFELLFFEIYVFTTFNYDLMALTLALVIIDGIVKLAITAVLIHTMTLPGVWWTPEQVVVPGGAPGAPGREWSTPNAGWNQPPYNQQQQQQFYPQPHPLFQQMQQPQQYSPPIQPPPNYPPPMRAAQA